MQLMSRSPEEIIDKMQRIDADISAQKLKDAGGWGHLNNGWYQGELEQIEQEIVAVGDPEKRDELLKMLRDLKDNADIDASVQEFRMSTREGLDDLREQHLRSILASSAERYEFPEDRLEEMKSMPWRRLPSYGFHFTTDDGPHAHSDSIAEHFASLPDGQVDFFSMLPMESIFTPKIPYRKREK